MQLFPQILVRAVVHGSCTVALIACGQQGPLYLPTQAGSAHRATLPESLLPKNTTTPDGNQPSRKTQALSTQ